ncbi:vWA domain-containing protein [Streptomyces cavernae]|uniref:vWA domain-containing protein n=1 Tax=Streptomyces cavernae TaxID=2259034 RepID=UPI000FEB5DB5|nr:VWA domain-containing protein [Streptomyces cavernae]
MRWEPARGRRARRLRAALLASALAGALVLTGCGGGGSADDSGYSSREKARGDSGPGPAPAPAQSLGPGEDFAEGRNDRLRPTGEPDPSDYLSTFALDVDTASYGYARRTLADGRRPDPAAIRPEEFVNSFRQDYERPDGNGFSVTVDGARTDREGWSLVRVGLATREAPDDSERPPAALTFVIDVSGSMAEPGRLDLVKDSLGVMTDRLRDDDSVALVTFSDDAETVLPMTRLGAGRGRIHDAIDSLEPSNSTNLGAGVEEGYAEAVEGRRPGVTNRVVLLSDALANTGDTDAGTILERIDGARREHGITLFGVGVGSDYGDALMERLADKGDGHTVYVSEPRDAYEVFCEQLPQNIDLAARDAKAQVAFDPETVEEYRLIGYDNRQVADEDFRDDRVDGGEVGPGHTVTALYAVRTRPGASGHLATATVRWQDPDTRSPHEESGRLEAQSLRDDLWTAPEGLRTTAIAAYFADALRRGDSRWASLPGTPSLRELTAHARELPRNKETEELTRALEQATEPHEY